MVLTNIMNTKNPLTQPFTKEERALIARYLISAPRGNSLFDYGVYILPSVLFGAYGLWVHDLIALFIGYLALFIVVVLYLNQQQRHQKLFYSVMEKYEARVRAVAKAGPRNSD